MKKIFSFMLLLCLAVGAWAQTSGYKPGARKSSFAAGDKMFIYNTCFYETQDRTGFYRNNGSSVSLLKKKPFAGDNYRYDTDGTTVWTVASVENVGTAEEPLYKMAVKNGNNTYLKFEMDAFTATESYIYVKAWTQTATDKRAGVKSEGTDGTTVENAAITAEHKLWTIANQAGSSYWNGNIGSVVTWSSGHPFAFYEADAMDETERSNVASAIETQKNTMFSPINTFLEECGVNVTLTPLTLTTANVSSNADENTGGGYTDGGGIAALFDLTDAGQPNTSTYFHSRWNGTAVNEYHYIQVDAGEAISAFTFGYSTRNGGEQHPTSMRVLGSTDGTNYTLIADIDKENFGLRGTYQGATETFGPRGFVLPDGVSYRYFRFAVTGNTSGGKFNGYPYFALSDFNFSKVTFSCNETYKANASILLNNYLFLQEAKAALSGVVDTEDYAFSKVNTTIFHNFSREASTTTSFPFTLTTDPLAPTAMMIKSGRGDYYYTWQPGENGKIRLYNRATASKNAYSHWYITRSQATGALYLHPYAAPTYRIGYTNSSDGPGKLITNDANRNMKFTYFNHTQGHCLRPYNAQTYVSNNGGTGNAMGFWNGVDGGTTFTVEDVTELPMAICDLAAVHIPKAGMTLPASNLVGTDLNLYSSTQYQAMTDITTRADELTEDEINAQIAVLRSMSSNTMLDMNKPTAGFYRLKNVGSNKYLTSNMHPTNDRMTLEAADNTRESVFYLTADNKLLGYSNGLFTQNFTSDNYAFEAVGHAGNAVNFVNGNVNTSPCYHINCGNRSLFGNSTTDEIVHVNGGTSVQTNNTDTGYDWTIEKVQYLPVDVSNEVKYGTLYTPVALSLRDGLTAYTGTITGDYWLHLNPVTGVIPAGSAVVLKDDGTAQRDETTGHIYLQVSNSTTAAAEGNALIGQPTTIAKVANAYTLQNNATYGLGFYPFSGTTLAGFKAYMLNGSGVRGFAFQEGETTSIEAAEGTQLNEPIYDLSGRRVQKATKGLFIVGGKKVFIK